MSGPREQSCSPDRGRAAVYEAERTAFGGTSLHDRLSFEVLTVRLEVMTAGSWWSAAGGRPVRVVNARAGTRSSRAVQLVGLVEIRLAEDQLDLVTLGHELGHGLAGVATGHDQRFRAAHADVIAVLGGAHHAASLLAAYEALGVPAGTRTWPAPWLAVGDGFATVP